MKRSNSSYDSLFGSFGSLEGLKNAIRIFALDVAINPANYPKAVKEANDQIEQRFPFLAEAEFRKAINGEDPFTNKSTGTYIRTSRVSAPMHLPVARVSRVNSRGLIKHDDTDTKAYNGNDRVDNFFAHYGRKGMKRGMNIFNPDYNPIGEKAKQLYTVAKVTSKIKSAEQTAEKLYSTGTKARNLIGNIRSDLQAKRNDAKNAEYQKQYEKEQREKDRQYAAERTAGNRRLAEAAAIESSMNSRNRLAQALKREPQSIPRANAEADAKNKAAIASAVYAAQKKEELRRQALLDAEKARYSKMNTENTEKAQEKKTRDALKEEIEADIKKDLDSATNEPSAIEKKANEVKDKAIDYASTAINTLSTVAKNEFGVSLDALKSDKDIAKILDFSGIKFSEMSLEDQQLTIEAKIEKLKKVLKEKAEKAAKSAIKNKFDEWRSARKKKKDPITGATERLVGSLAGKMLAHSDEDRIERFFNSRREVITDANV